MKYSVTDLYKKETQILEGVLEVLGNTATITKISTSKAAEAIGDDPFCKTIIFAGSLSNIIIKEVKE